MNQIKIGKYLSKKRKEKGLTQVEMAKIIGVTDRAISNWENGRRIPDVSLFNNICEALDITVNELINGEDISKDKVISKNNESLIKVLKNNKNNKRRFIYVLGISIVFVFTLIFWSYKSIYPKIDIYSIILDADDPDKGFKTIKKFTYDNRDYYYYGITGVSLCDVNGKCYELESSLKHGQTSLTKINEYLDSQVNLGNTTSEFLYDGGTTIYGNERYQIAICKTLDDNKDIYIGLDDMINNLNGKYCGRSENKDKSFKRTYYVSSASISDDKEFSKVHLVQSDGESDYVLLNITNNLVVGKTYEFLFLAFEEFEDTISNLFEYATIIDIKLAEEDINEDIIVNEKYESNGELNEVDNVSMEIMEGTLTKEGASVIITDLNKDKNGFGLYYRIDKKENDEWKPLEIVCDNCAFNEPAYFVDRNNKLVFHMNWKKLYGTLDKGYYRIVKDICVGEFCESHKYFSVEFKID